MTVPAFFKGQMTCRVESTILCKNVTFVTLKYLYLAHNTSKCSTLYVLYYCVPGRKLYKILTAQHKMKVGQGRNFSKILSKFQIFRYVTVILFTIWLNKLMGNVMANILVYYMNSYTNYL